jgi:hypothetical protein
MKRFLILCAVLFVSITLWSSTASAAGSTYYSGPPVALNACTAAIESRCNGNCSCVQLTASEVSSVYGRTNAGGWGHWTGSVWGNGYMYSNGNSGCTGDEVVDPDSGQCVAPPSDCESPNYIDVVTSECVAPRSVCFTSIHTEENECTYVGGEDPDDPETPAGCTRNYNTGDLICVADDVPAGGEADCFTVNGEQICPTPEAVCGNKNGSFQCLEPQQKGCGSFNGENVCVDPTGHVVPVDDPDHPENGGNLDGNSKNDPTDSRDPADGGDPNNQPNAPIDTGANEGSSEKTSRESNLKLGKIETNTESSAKSLKEIALNGLNVNNLSEEISDSASNSILQNADSEALISGSNDEMFDFIEGIDVAATGGGYGGGMVSGITDAATDIIPQGTCSELGFAFKSHSFSLGCDKTERIRDLLSWVFYILTVWFLFDVVTSPTTRQK